MFSCLIAIQKNSRHIWTAVTVEMRGIEPRSEKKTIMTSTSIVHSQELTHPTRNELGSNRLFRHSLAPKARTALEASPTKSTPFCNSSGETAEDGLLN